MNTGNQFGMGRNYFNMLNYDDSNGPKMNSFIDRNENDQVIALSTCSEADTNGRMILFGKLMKGVK